MKSASANDPGRIITFYSFKGGTGRTMALANIACLLARRPKSKGVLIIDWDLEAPGLHRFFQDKLKRQFGTAEQAEQYLDMQPGLIDLFIELRNAITTSNFRSPDKSSELFEEVSPKKFMINTSIPFLRMLKAGRFDETYPTKVGTFQWEKFYNEAPWLMTQFTNYLMKNYSYVLIDSRTGTTDISGICTMLMPEKLVAVFTPNRQSLLGVLDHAQQAIDYRRQSDDLRPLVVYPLPTRIEQTEPRLHTAWRYGDTALRLKGYQQEFTDLLMEAYDLKDCDLDEYFSDVLIQHVPYYAYGEEIAVLSERRSDRLSLTRSYECFAERLIDLAGPWEELPPHSKTKGARVADITGILDVGAIMPLTGREAERLNVVEYVRQLALKGRPQAAKQLLRKTRKELDQLIPQKVVELNQREIPSTLTREQIQQKTAEYAAEMQPILKTVEQFVLASIEENWNDGAKIAIPLSGYLISSSELPPQGVSIKIAKGLPALFAWQLLTLAGAKALEEENFVLLGFILNEPIEVEEFGGKFSNRTFLQRADLFHPEAFLDHADYAIQYVSKLWDSQTHLHAFFESQAEYHFNLAKFLMVYALASQPDKMGHPPYPGYRLVPEARRALRALCSRMSASADYLEGISQAMGTTSKHLFDTWSVRVEQANSAKLGANYLEIRDWFPDPMNAEFPDW